MFLSGITLCCSHRTLTAFAVDAARHCFAGTFFHTGITDTDTHLFSSSPFRFHITAFCRVWSAHEGVPDRLSDIINVSESVFGMDDQKNFVYIPSSENIFIYTDGLERRFDFSRPCIVSVLKQSDPELSGVSAYAPVLKCRVSSLCEAHPAVILFFSEACCRRISGGFTSVFSKRFWTGPSYKR